MTEESFQQARKLMQKANYARGMIAKAKGEVAKWTKIEDVHKRNLSEGQAVGAKKCLDKAMIRLDQERAKFAALKFPADDIVKEYAHNRCVECGAIIAQSENYCGECLCENDSDY